MKKAFKSLKEQGSTFAKSVLIGATLRVPGMSGGTTAIILRIYDRLLDAVNNFFKNIKKNAAFLSVFIFGGGLAFIAFNSLVFKVTNNYPAVSAYFFSGIILFGIPPLIKESKSGEKAGLLSDEKPFAAAIPLFCGVLTVAAVSLLQNHGILDGSGYNGFLRFVFNVSMGFFAGIALVLPGLSFTYFLTVIGLMDTLSQSISFSSADLGFVFSFGLGVLIGLIATAKVLDGFVKKHKQGTYACVIGFLLGSVAMLLTDSKNLPKAGEIPLCAIFFVFGAALILFASRLASKNGICSSNSQGNI